MSQPFSGMKDILFGYDTDIQFAGGDLMLTTGLDYIEREMYKLLITSPTDWKTNLNIGCSPNKFTGEKNTRAVGEEIKAYLENGLRDTCFPTQINVRIVPVDYEKIVGFIELFALENMIFRLPFEFDYINGFKKLTIVDPAWDKLESTTNINNNSIADTSRPNKYKSRLRDNTF